MTMFQSTNFDAATVPAVTPDSELRSTAAPAIVNDPQSRLPATANELKTPVPPSFWYLLSAVAMVK
ncbi:hypothetical protein F442_17161 [Phytophthora nicotianae P10297]|uniref:Uncharacterized protein n=3 Tax=Phytophthora nicotianae TaxID=4792 RepID=W2YHW1_PHYNI|nr:hypothetical protein F442_17161 [Phytophthora nicotianae P10297]